MATERPPLVFQRKGLVKGKSEYERWGVVGCRMEGRARSLMVKRRYKRTKNEQKVILDGREKAM